jgi:hypothetical protein
MTDDAAFASDSSKPADAAVDVEIVVSAALRSSALGVSLFALASLVAGCDKASAPRPAPAPATGVPGTAVALKVLDTTDAAGLRIRSGALPASGAGKVWGFTDVVLDASRTRLEIVLAKDGAALSALLPAGGLAVVNGGYFETDFRPSTWVKNAGVELSPKSDTSKGGVLALGGGGVFVGPFSGLSFEPDLAVQSFPLIVEPERKIGIRRDDGRRAARTIACLVDRRLHFIVISAPRGEGPTLFESASLLLAGPPAGFGCRVALNLDGGPSTGVWFSPSIGARSRPPLAPVAYAIAVLPR